MRSNPAPGALAFILLFCAPGFAHARHVAVPRKFPVGGSAPSGAKIQMPADLARRMARWPVVEMPFHARGLAPREAKMIGKLVEASRVLDSIYWRQSDPYALTLAAQLKGSALARDGAILRYLSINGGQYDLLDGNRSFIHGEAAPEGRGFYPLGATRERVESFVAMHPEARTEIFSPYTVVRSMGSELVGLPYGSAFRGRLQTAATELREAAALGGDAAFAGFLKARADALLSDDYEASDLLWLELAKSGTKQPGIDLIFGPYRMDLDRLFGVKLAYGAAILIRDDAESQKLATFEPYLAQIQQSLPLADSDRRDVGATTLEVVDSPFRAGALGHGFQTLAITLPVAIMHGNQQNLARQGSRIIFFENLSDARFQRVILPVIRKLMEPPQSGIPAAGDYFTTVEMREIGRGLGPDTDRAPGSGGKSIREALGPSFAALDEAKGDVAGMYAVGWLLDRGLLLREREQELYACELAEMLRSMLPGAAQAPAQLMEFSYLMEQGAIVAHAGTLSHGTARVVFAVDAARLPAAVAALNRELLAMEAGGDRTRVAQWFARYGNPSEALRTALESAGDVPVDVVPRFSWELPIKE